MGSTEQFTLYCDCTPVIDTWYKENDDQAFIEAVLSAIAEIEDVPRTDLPPLYKTIDPNVLTQLVEQDEEASDAKKVLSFRYCDWNTFVHASGRIRVCDGDRSTDPKPVFEDRIS